MDFGENFSFCFGILLRVHDMHTIGKIMYKKPWVIL